MTVINYAPEWNLFAVATDAPAEGINLQQRERAA